jgi:hypothetical protein
MDRFNEAYQNGELNIYFLDRLERKVGFLPNDLLDVYFEEAKKMSILGVDSAEEEKTFFHILSYTQDILLDLAVHLGNTHKIKMIPSIVYKNRKKYPINTLHDFYVAVAEAAKEIDLPLKEGINDKIVHKKAYPSAISAALPQTMYNIDKWVDTTRDIYNEAKTIGLSKAFDKVTANWDAMEKLNFKSFLSFYQEGAQSKYKIAQFGKHNIDENTIQFPEGLKAKLPTAPAAPAAPKPKEDGNDARAKIEEQRYKIISRLNAAEKLLYSLDGQFFAGNGQEEMLRMLQDLKRKVQTSNKMTVESSLFVDYIYRVGNMFNVAGKDKAAGFFYKIAQEATGEPVEAVPPTEEVSAEPAATTDEPGAEAVQLEGDPSSMDSEVADPSMGNETEAVIKEFIGNLEEGVSDIDLDDFEKLGFIVEGQEMMAPAPQPPPRDLEVREDELGSLTPELDKLKRGDPEGIADLGRNPDDAIDAALNDVTIDDVVRRLGILSAFFKKREVPKQLAIVDLMMDRLGIGSFFPSLGESTRSALESNSYVSTRIEDILSKLQGSLISEDAEALFDSVLDPVTPETAELANNLKKNQDVEDRRKAMRRQKETAKLDAESERPEQVAELAEPAVVENQAPVITNDRQTLPEPRPAPAPQALPRI